MRQKATTYSELIKMAETYGVENNALFVSAANQYITQQEVIEMIRSALADDDRAVVTKEYVKGRENIQANPLIMQLPKQVDSANRTLAMMLDIIQKLGREKQESRFGDMYDE